MNKISIHFHGPFSWRNDLGLQCVFEAPEGKSSGIYLQTVKSDHERFAYYIGETGRPFASRQKEHLKEHMAGFYHILDGDALKNGKKKLLWNGMYGIKSRESIQSLFEKWESLSKAIEEQTKFVEFFLAQTNVENVVRKEIEKALAIHFSETQRDFQDGGVQYRGTKTQIPVTDVELSASCDIVGFPNHLRIGGEQLTSRTFITPYDG